MRRIVRYGFAVVRRFHLFLNKSLGIIGKFESFTYETGLEAPFCPLPADLRFLISFKLKIMQNI